MHFHFSMMVERGIEHVQDSKPGTPIYGSQLKSSPGFSI